MIWPACGEATTPRSGSQTSLARVLEERTQLASSLLSNSAELDAAVSGDSLGPITKHHTSIDDPADVLATSSRSTVGRSVISAGTHGRVWTTNHGNGA